MIGFKKKTDKAFTYNMSVFYWINIFHNAECKIFIQHYINSNCSPCIFVLSWLDS